MASSKLLSLIVKNVDLMLAEKDLSRSDLARGLGISPQSMSQFMTGRHSPNVDRLIEIAAFFKIPAFYLLMTYEERKKWESMDEKSPYSSAVLDNLKQSMDLLRQSLQKK